MADADGSNITPVTDSPGSDFDGRCDWRRATPTEVSDCLKGGWQQYNTPEHTLFRNQGQCVAWATNNR